MYNFNKKLAIGTPQFGLYYGIEKNQKKNFITSQKNIKKILDHAFKKGICTVDTAHSYGNSQKKLGKCKIKKWKVITKIPVVTQNSDVYRWVKTIFKKSLKELKLSSVYGVLVHNPKDLFSKNGKEIYRALDDLKKEKFVKKIGVSIYDMKELAKILSNYKIDIVQAPFNILDRRLKQQGWFKELKKRKIEIHVRSIFLKGLLLRTKKNRPNKFKKWNKVWKEWDNYLLKSKRSANEICLNYALSHPEIDKIIVGIRSLKEIHEITKIKKINEKIISKISTNDKRLIDPRNWDNL